MRKEVAEQFPGAAEAALRGDYDAWAAEPRSRLALILVQDQFTRTLYPNTPRAYAGDQIAQRLAVEALDVGFDQDLNVHEGLFMLMPLVHAEDLALQERAVILMERLVADTPEALGGGCARGVEQTHKYRDVIARFGRFPHRDVALGRESTPEEVTFLSSWQLEPSDVKR